MSYQRRVPFSHPGFDDFAQPAFPPVRRTTDPWETFTNRPSRGFDHSFGDALRDDEFFTSGSIVPHRGYFVTTPSRQGVDTRVPTGAATGDMQLTSTEFKVAVDAANFKPEELDVKVSDLTRPIIGYIYIYIITRCIMSTTYADLHVGQIYMNSPSSIVGILFNSVVCQF